MEKYQDLAFEIRRIHGASKVTVIPIVIGALGSISKRAKTWYDKLGVPEFIGSVQLSAILGTAHLLRLFSNHSAVKREQIIFILNIVRRRQGSGKRHLV